MKKKILELMSADEYVKGVQQFAPNFTPNIASYPFQHWVQPDANIGYINEMAALLHSEIVKRSDGDRTFLSDLENNSIDFGFDFTNSKAGEILRDKGYTIYEKTGYYQSVNWVSDLAKQGFPIHMALCNIVTIVPPRGSHQKIRTFYQSTNYKMPFPEGREDFGDVSFLDVDSEEYTRKIEAAKEVAFRQYRERQEDIYRAVLQI